MFRYLILILSLAGLLIGCEKFKAKEPTRKIPQREKFLDGKKSENTEGQNTEEQKKESKTTTPHTTVTAPCQSSASPEAAATPATSTATPTAPTQQAPSAASPKKAGPALLSVDEEPKQNSGSRPLPSKSAGPIAMAGPIANGQKPEKPEKPVTSKEPFTTKYLLGTWVKKTENLWEPAQSITIKENGEVELITLRGIPPNRTQCYLHFNNVITKAESPKTELLERMHAHFKIQGDETRPIPELILEMDKKAIELLKWQDNAPA
ncbi:MAG: hypothetical protein AB7H97_16830, partial [Pseudobdellovibrionaceae bacterium]